MTGVQTLDAVLVAVGYAAGGLIVLVTAIVSLALARAAAIGDRMLDAEHRPQADGQDEVDPSFAWPETVEPAKLPRIDRGAS